MRFPTDQSFSTLGTIKLSVGLLKPIRVNINLIDTQEQQY